MVGLSFLVLGDWGRRGTPAQQATARGFAQVAEQLRSSFVVSTGDNFYEHGVSSPDDSHWAESFETVYDAASLQVPWHATLGNHDYRGSVEAQIAYTHQSDRWHLPSRYYAVTYPLGESTEALFVFLDTTPFLACYREVGEEYLPRVADQDAQAQLDWLDATLAASGARWKIVVGHHAIRSGSPCHGSAEELDRTVGRLLHRHGVHAYFCGHEHDLQHLTSGGLHHVVSGAGSERRPTGRIASTRFAAATLGFVAATLSPDRMRLFFLNERGRLLYQTLLSPDRRLRRLHTTYPLVV